MGSINDYLPSRIKRNMSNDIQLAGNAYPFNQGLATSQAAAANVATTNTVFSAAGQYSRDTELVGVFKLVKAEDGYIVKCAPGEGYQYKTYVAADINEALDKAKAYLVTEALSK